MSQQGNYSNPSDSSGPYSAPRPQQHNPAGGPSGPGQFQPQHYQQPTPAPKKSSTGKIVLIVVGVMLLLCALGGLALIGLGGKAADSVSNQIEQDATSRLADVKIKSCKQGSLGNSFVDITYTVTNSSDTKQSYLIQFDVYAADGTTRLGEAHGAVNDLAPGSTANEEASGTVSGSLSGAKCKVASA